MSKNLYYSIVDVVIAQTLSNFLNLRDALNDVKIEILNRNVFKVGCFDESQEEGRGEKLFFGLIL